MKRKTILAILLTGTMLLGACVLQTDMDADSADHVEDINESTPDIFALMLGIKIINS